MSFMFQKKVIVIKFPTFFKCSNYQDTKEDSYINIYDTITIHKYLNETINYSSCVNGCMFYVKIINGFILFM